MYYEHAHWWISGLQELTVEIQASGRESDQFSCSMLNWVAVTFQGSQLVVVYEVFGPPSGARTPVLVVYGDVCLGPTPSKAKVVVWFLHSKQELKFSNHESVLELE